MDFEKDLYVAAEFLDKRLPILSCSNSVFYNLRFETSRNGAKHVEVVFE